MHKYEKHSWGEPGGENYNGPCNRCSQGFGFAVYHRTRTDCNKDQSAVDAVTKDTGLRPQNRGRKPQNKPSTREREAPQEKLKYPGECVHCKTVGARRTFHIFVNPDDCIHNPRHALIPNENEQWATSLAKPNTWQRQNLLPRRTLQTWTGRTGS